MKMHAQSSFPLATMAAAIMAAYAPAYAEEPTLEELTTPASTISVGAGYVSKDAPQFGRYNGLREKGTYGLLNFDLNKRDDDEGTWIKMKGSNLGLDNREMRFSQERQGNWAYFVDYNELQRFDPNTANTAVAGIGSPNLSVPTSAAAVEVPRDLKIKREALGLGYSKVLGNGFDFLVRLRNEEKNGTRIFSRGTATNAFEFTPEPINSTTRQLDAILGYSDKKLQVQGAYYGTSYNNHNTALNITGGAAALSGFNVIGLPPDSQSHQLSFGGGYSFTPVTRATFKLAYTRATQDDTFIAGVPVNTGISPTGNLGGRVDTTQFQLGLSSRPMPKLSLIGDVRYEDRNDKTPIRLYTTNGVTPTSSFSGENEPRSIRTTTGKLEATYRMPMEMRITGGLDYVEKDRNTSAIRVVSYREKTEETSYRIMLSRAMSETVTGSIAYIHSIRNGSDFLTTVLNCGSVTCTNGATTATALNLIAPLHLADRERDKVRLSVNWTPSEELSLQFMADQTRDDYGSRTPDEFGLRDGMSKNVSFDLSYALSDNWQANGWISKNDTLANRADRTTPTNPWASSLLNNGKSFGLGLRGKASEKIDVGVDLSHSDILDSYRQWAISGPAVAPLPEVFTRQTSLKLFGTYALDKSASIRLDYIYDRFVTNDWTWASWTYSDGTYLSQQPRQSVNFIGVTYIYKFR